MIYGSVHNLLPQVQTGIRHWRSNFTYLVIIRILKYIDATAIKNKKDFEYYQALTNSCVTAADTILHHRPS